MQILSTVTDNSHSQMNQSRVGEQPYKLFMINLHERIGLGQGQIKTPGSTVRCRSVADWLRTGLRCPVIVSHYMFHHNCLEVTNHLLLFHRP